MLNGYSYLAEVYDELMEDVDYEKWAERIDHLIQAYSKLEIRQGSSILDFACGTGNLSYPLSDKGYIVTGVDLSPEMLMIAENKRKDDPTGLYFLLHDMRDFPTHRIYDHVICGCDGVNYLLEEEDLTAFFSNVYRLLSEKGVFIFDISSPFKLETILGNNFYGEDRERVSYLWENTYDQKEAILDMELTFFVKAENGYYRKLKEYHTQKAHSVEELTMLLKNTGFTRVDIFDDLTDDPPGKTSERILFCVGKSHD